MNYENLIREFTSNLIPYGWLDMKCALELYYDVGLTPEDLADDVREFSESCETPLDKIDVCYIAYDRVLQSARNKISDVLDFDIANDISDGEFYTYGNYCDSSWDYSETAVAELQSRIDKATPEQIEILFEDEETKYFLNEINIKTN